MLLSKIDGSFSKSIGTKISVESGIGSKLDKDTRVNTDSKSGTKSQNWGSVSHSQSSSISF